MLAALVLHTLVAFAPVATTAASPAAASRIVATVVRTGPDSADPDWRVVLATRAAGRHVGLSATDDGADCAGTTTLPRVPDGVLRACVDAVDRTLDGARRARDARRVDDAGYVAILRWLRDVELAVHAEAGRRTFGDRTVHDYWHRGRLKFPTLTQQELDRLVRGASR